MTGMSSRTKINTRYQTVATILQLQTGDRGLNFYIHHFGIKNISYRESGYGKEIMEYYLGEYRKYNHKEGILLKIVKPANMTVEILARHS